MSASLIAKLIIALGPVAFGVIKDLMAIWSKDSLTPDEVIAFCTRHQKNYDDYIAEAKAKLITTPV